MCSSITVLVAFQNGKIRVENAYRLHVCMGMQKTPVSPDRAMARPSEVHEPRLTI
jgi:hypothetical protein